MEFVYINKRSFFYSGETLFAMIKDAEKWPLFIEECKEVKILEKDGNQCIRYMKSIVNHKMCEMKTRCIYIDQENKMTFEQIESPWPIKSNRGQWYIRKISDCEVQMCLEHRVVARYGLVGALLMKIFIGKYFIYSHAEKILDEFEKYLKEMLYDKNVK